MINLDTSVVVRYLTQDDRAQAAAANRLFEQRLTDDDPGYLTMVALTEVVWVLDAGYRLNRIEIAGIIDKLLRTRVVVVEASESVAQALRTFRQGTADFADCLIERRGAAAGCTETLTFDKAAARDAGMTLLQPRP